MSAQIMPDGRRIVDADEWWAEREFLRRGTMRFSDTLLWIDRAIGVALQVRSKRVALAHSSRYTPRRAEILVEREARVRRLLHERLDALMFGGER